MKLSPEEQIAAASEVNSSEVNPFFFGYKMKFDVPGWDKKPGRYIGCITDESFNQDRFGITDKFYYCANSYCKNYLNQYRQLPTADGFYKEHGIQCAYCNHDLLRVYQKSDIPEKIIAGQGRLSHRF